MQNFSGDVDQMGDILQIHAMWGSINDFGDELIDAIKVLSIVRNFGYSSIG